MTQEHLRRISGQSKNLSSKRRRLHALSYLAMDRGHFVQGLHGLSQSELELMLKGLYEKGLPRELLWRNGENQREKLETEPESILLDIRLNTKVLKKRDSFIDDCLQLKYVNEVCRSEQKLNPEEETATLEICADAIDSEWVKVTEALKELCGERSGRMTIQFQNLCKELDRLFKSGQAQALQPTPGSMEFIKEVHRNLMSGLLDSNYTGTFRENVVGPSGTGLTYLSPELIPSRLQYLLDFVDEEAKKIHDVDENKRNERFILLGALLFAKFLYIHPFRDGNGRVARLLLNTFLSGVFIVPFSLYLDHSSRERSLYLDLLENATREPTELHPVLQLAGYILLNSQQQVAFLVARTE